MDVLCAVIGMTAVVLGVMWFVRAVAASGAAWQSLIDAHGLTSSKHRYGRSVTGTIDKTPFTYADGERWASLTVRVPREELGDLHIAPEHVLNRLAKKLGGQDITLGDPTFDSHWRITCSQPQIAKNVLTRGVRVAFHNTQTDLIALDRGGMLRLEDGELRWASGRPGIRPQVLPDMVRTLGKLARKFAPKAPDATSPRRR